MRPASGPNDLRRKAEEKAAGMPENLDKLPAEEVRALLHELQVHQIELEAQNEELRRTQVELEASRARYFDLYDLAPVGYFTLGEQGLIEEANLTAAALLGETRGALVRQPFSRFVVAEDQDVYYRFRNRLVETGETQVCDLRLKRKGAAMFWARVEARAARDGDGAPVCRAVLIDLTERKQAEARQAQAQKMESIGRLAGGIAHDFNNLLTVINGYSKLLLDGVGPGDPQRSKLAEILKAGERAAGLTRQLLAFSRKQVFEPRVLEINHVVGGMQSLLERLVGEDVAVGVALKAGAGMILADLHQLEQVIMNLAANARDAMPRGGELRIETACVELDESYVQANSEARVGSYVRLTVSDTGVGMDEETRKSAFEPFFTTKEFGQGTGLGLAVVQGIVAQSGGWIEVSSEPGHGTVFSIYLPRLKEAVADVPPPAPDAMRGVGETVLVVEDQAEVREFAAEVLKAYGYRVIKAGSAAEALLLCQRERIDLVLTDVVMPNVGGRELADRLEELYPGIKLLFMSGYTDDMVEQHGVLENGAKFVQKPFSPKQLAAKVRESLGAPKGN